MKKFFFLGLTFLSMILNSGCETPQNTLNEASQDIQKGISGQGHLEERNWDEVEAF